MAGTTSMGGATSTGGTTGTTMSCSLGTATSGNSAIYLPALNMAQTMRSVSMPQGSLFSGRDLATPDSSLVVRLTCTMSGRNFATGSVPNLIVGKVWVTVGTATLPTGL